VNIVGYQTMSTLSGKMDIAGVQFEGVNGVQISIQDIVPVSGFSDGLDLIKVWDPVARTYVSAYYFSDVYADYDYDLSLGAGWADIDQIKIDLTIDPGQAFWITTASDASFTIAGQVVGSTDNQVSTLSGKMDLICNTFPASLSIQDVEPVSGFSDGLDLIKVWDAVNRTYTSAYYFSDVYADYDYDPSLGAGWADIDQIKVDVVIAEGQGFWLTTANDAVVSFTAPAGL
jgi:hypothetical protein